jgi:hypothetical protein
MKRQRLFAHSLFGVLLLAACGRGDTAHQQTSTTEPKPEVTQPAGETARVIELTLSFEKPCPNARQKRQQGWGSKATQGCKDRPKCPDDLSLHGCSVLHRTSGFPSPQIGRVTHRHHREALRTHQGAVRSSLPPFTSAFPTCPGGSGQAVTAGRRLHTPECAPRRGR